MKKSSPPRHLPAEQVLAAVPYRNEAMELHHRRDGTALASIPLRKPRWLVPPLSWVIPFSSHRRVELDTAGVAVLDLCDGSRNVESIIEKFAADHKLSFREAQLSVTKFLQQLTQRGVIAVVGLSDDATKNQQA
ncbi:MAG: PqqD family protein [Phycisphaerae bacterium]